MEPRTAPILFATAPLVGTVTTPVVLVAGLEGGLLLVVAVLLVQAVVEGLEEVVGMVVAATLAEVEREEPVEGA